MGDLSTIAICTVVFILLGTSYVVRNNSFRIFSAIVGCIFLAAFIHVGYNELTRNFIDNRPDAGYRFILYGLRLLYHTLLFQVFFLFGLYATVVSNLEHKRAREIAIVLTVMFIATIVTDIVLSITKVGFYIPHDYQKIQESYVYLVAYAVFFAFLTVVLIRVRKLVYKRVFWGFMMAMLLAAIIRFSQMFLGESSLTTFVFVIPVLAMLYIMHHNPYNVTTGTLNVKAMEDMVKNLYDRKKQFIIMSMLLPDFMGEGKTLPEEVRNQTRRFTVEFFRNGTLFQVGNGQIIMIARKDSNPDFNDWMQVILKAFQEQYRIYKLPYKIVYGDSFESEIGQSQYLSLIDSIHKNIPDNTMHRIDENDIIRFKEGAYIVDQLKDIYEKCDLNDPRVLVYCQPVFNIQSRCFDTAEALMRLNLENAGIVNPGAFIPIAESRGYIHVLTKIILNKTCQAIRKMNEEGIAFKRISVNVSMLELKEDNFCTDFNRILYDNGVSGDKIAIELTESQSEEDFLVMKEKIDVLHEEGIQFYLDDFGTGYSNMERILELPFDIIKFDRSMVIASGQDKRSEHIVEKLAKMFSDFNYFVLYEGIEDNADENRCVSMSATYLQGFKYSKPVPIDQLASFFARSTINQNLI